MALDHSQGVRPAHRLIREPPGLAERGPEERSLGVVPIPAALTCNEEDVEAGGHHLSRRSRRLFRAPNVIFVGVVHAAWRHPQIMKMSGEGGIGGCIKVIFVGGNNESH